jgi:cysteine desulfuration protein SufE
VRFLLRAAFWLSVVVVLLPASPSAPGPPGPRVSATEAVSAANAAVFDMRHFCSRQPDACAVRVAGVEPIRPQGASRRQNALRFPQRQAERRCESRADRNPGPASRVDILAELPDAGRPHPAVAGTSAKAPGLKCDWGPLAPAPRGVWPSLRLYVVGDGPRTAAGAKTIMTIDDIIENFSLLDEWDDRYRYVIELGRTLAPLPDARRTDANKVQGCASQVWLATTVKPDSVAGPILNFTGDSDAFIVRGLIAILLALYSGKSAGEILATDAIGVFDRLGLREHLTPQRSNGFRSMVERLKGDARAVLAQGAPASVV